MNSGATPPTAPPPAQLRKPTPIPALTRPQVVAMLGAGVVGAIALPGNEAGLGIAVTWIAIAIAVLVTRPRDSWTGPWRRVVAGVAVAAAGLPVISDTGWVVVPVMLITVGFAALALAGGTTWLGLLRPTLRCVPVGLGSVVAVTRGLRRWAPTSARRHSGARATLLTLVLLGGFGALFASADQLLGSFVERLVPDLDLGLLPARIVVAAVVTVGAATLVRLVSRQSDDRPMAPPSSPLRGVEWQVPLVGMTLLFASFVSLQFGVLFGGHDRVLQAAGLTYAEYARSGFGQLVAVAILTLVVIAATVRLAETDDRRSERIQRSLLAALCLLTLVVLGSAFHRLSLYEDAFGFTRLRFAAQVIIWWLAAVFALVLATGVTRRARTLPRAVVVLTAIAVVGVGYLQPDAIIASRNVERFVTEGRIDVDYLAGLSADAVPALLELPPDVRGCVLRRYLIQDDPDTLGSWNRPRARSGRLLEAAGPLPTCDNPGRWDHA